jgi:hypothetical protein
LQKRLTPRRGNEGQAKEEIMVRMFLSMAALTVLAGGLMVSLPAQPAAGASGSQMATSPSQVEPTESPDVRAETWWRIRMYEWDRNRWVYAGSFENPDRQRCITYGNGWNSGGRRGYRKYTGPFSFTR